MSLVLSLFPGIGLLDMAFEAEGFCIVRGPDLLWGGDIHAFHPPAGKFDGVIGGPPCQAFSRLRYLVEHNGYHVAPNLIPEFERCVSDAQPVWFLMENVAAAPLPVVEGYLVRDQLLNNRECGGTQNRVRRFSFGTKAGRDLELDWWKPQMSAEWEPAVCANGGYAPVYANGRVTRPKPASALGYKSQAAFRVAVRAQGLPESFDLPGLTVSGKLKAVGNGVPLPMGRAIARAVKASLEVT